MNYKVSDPVHWKNKEYKWLKDDRDYGIIK
jgi:hypothetical protein